MWKVRQEMGGGHGARIVDLSSEAMERLVTLEKLLDSIERK